MPNSLQLWLSPRPIRTDGTANPSVTSAGGAILYEFLRAEDDGREVAMETHYISNPLVKAGKSGPPLHIHIRQDETFQVLSGILAVSINGQERLLTPSSGRVTVPHGARHRFWPHPSSTEDTKFHVWVEPQGITVEKGFDESFLRNFAGYLADCENQKMEPSLFQLILFLYNSEILLTPPFWLPMWFLIGLHHFLAHWVGEALLGYRTSYPEYSKMGREMKLNKAI